MNAPGNGRWYEQDIFTNNRLWQNFSFLLTYFPQKRIINIRDGKPSSGEFLPDSGKLYIQESSCQIVENFINQEIPCQTVGNFKIKG